MQLKNSEEQFDLEAIREVIAKLFPTGHSTLEHVTNTLGISPRTLQRRLAGNGLTFTQLTDEVRFITARQLIIQGEKLADVATHLGYADAGSFTRAFERWTGMSPQKYRKQFTGRSTVAKSRAKQ